MQKVKASKKLFTRTFVCVIVITTMIEGDTMKILKGYVFKKYPNKKQEKLINKTITLPKLKEVKIREYRNKEVKDLKYKKMGMSSMSYNAYS